MSIISMHQLETAAARADLRFFVVTHEQPLQQAIHTICFVGEPANAASISLMMPVHLRLLFLRDEHFTEAIEALVRMGIAESPPWSRL